MMLIDHAELHRIALRIFEAAGSQPDGAQLIADHLIEANLRGHEPRGSAGGDHRPSRADPQRRTHRGGQSPDRVGKGSGP